jgi:hypothetical protein
LPNISQPQSGVLISPMQSAVNTDLRTTSPFVGGQNPEVPLNGRPAAVSNFALKLKAVSRGPNGDLAMINDSMVKVGESINGFTVDAIEQNGVWLRNSTGRTRLEFER